MRSHYNKYRSFIPYKYYYFSTYSPSTLMCLSYRGTSWSRNQVCIWNHSQTTTSTSSVLWNWRASKCCLNCPKWVEGLEVSSETNATTLVSDVCCVGMHCHAEWSYLVTDHKFTPLKCHLGGWQFHSNKEVTVYEQLLMQEPELYHYRIFKFKHTWDKFIDALENYVKNNYNSWIREWHVML